jgi:hypothetical protein
VFDDLIILQSLASLQVDIKIKNRFEVFEVYKHLY